MLLLSYLSTAGDEVGVVINNLSDTFNLDGDQEDDGG